MHTEYLSIKSAPTSISHTELEDIGLCKNGRSETQAAVPIGTACLREDPRDALVTRGGATLASLRSGAIVGTSSVRRAAQLLAARPDLRVVPGRGNVDTRGRKVRGGGPG